jgi:membrane fusion protein, heavy metal efflux system
VGAGAGLSGTAERLRHNQQRNRATPWKLFIRRDGQVGRSATERRPATVDLFYELPNPDGRFRPGERVEVVLPLAGETQSLVVPRAAILRDIHGVAWVYTNSAEHTFERHRVEVHFTTKELSILSRGPAAGTLVVVDGAAELFGTEFGAGK